MAEEGPRRVWGLGLYPNREATGHSALQLGKQRSIQPLASGPEKAIPFDFPSKELIQGPLKGPLKRDPERSVPSFSEWLSDVEHIS